MSTSSERIRSAGVVLHNEQLLLMFRRKDGREYYTFPGGGVEDGESSADAAVREIAEEMGITVSAGPLLYELVRNGGMHEYFFNCTYQAGEPMLAHTSEEHEHSHDENIYRPVWVPIGELSALELLPPEVALQFAHDLEHSFSETPILLEGAPIIS